MEIAARYALGYFMIALLFFYVVCNTIVIIYYSLDLLFVYIRRIFVQCRRKKLQGEAAEKVKKINTELAAEKDWFSPVELNSNKEMLVCVASLAYGYSAVLVPRDPSAADDGKDRKNDKSQSESDEKEVSVESNSKDFFAPDDIGSAERKYDKPLLHQHIMPYTETMLVYEEVYEENVPETLGERSSPGKIKLHMNQDEYMEKMEQDKYKDKD